MQIRSFGLRPISSRRTRSAFTLIELLVVIAIIAILAAILFPVFAQARAKARETTCASNMRQIGIASLMYANDYDETMPWHTNGQAIKQLPAPPGGNPSTILMTEYWIPVTGDFALTGQKRPFDPNDPYVLKPYIKNTGILQCPEVREQSGIWLNYAMNNWTTTSSNLITGNPGGHPRSTSFTVSVSPGGAHLSMIANPAGTVYAWEHFNEGVLCTLATTTPGHWNTGHSNGLTLLWADGHVKRQALGQLFIEMFTFWREPNER
jgi:prepilin-type N-terminal cleavage/methylation domain-containing protein/prepilin-type processing-associated H-X9-DG protein